FNLYLTPEQQTQLLNEVRSEKGNEKKSNKELEEILADRFAEYVQSEGVIKPKSFLKKLFEDLYYWIKDIVGLTSTRDIFYKINTGKFANSPIKNSKFKQENKYKVVEGFNPLEQK